MRWYTVEAVYLCWGLNVKQFEFKQ